MGRTEEETMRSPGLGLRQLGNVIRVTGEMEGGVVNGKMMDSPSDTVGLKTI